MFFCAQEITPRCRIIRISGHVTQFSVIRLEKFILFHAQGMGLAQEKDTHVGSTWIPVHMLRTTKFTCLTDLRERKYSAANSRPKVASYICKSPQEGFTVWTFSAPLKMCKGSKLAT
jgi:hypothetical protein